MVSGRPGLRNLSPLRSYTGRGEHGFWEAPGATAQQSSSQFILRPSQALQRSIVCDTICCNLYARPPSSCNIPPPRGRTRLHLAAYIGHRLPSQTNTSLFCTLCPHSCAPGKNFPVDHPSPNFSGPSTFNLGVLWRLASQSVTHPQISPGQARLTSEFFGDQPGPVLCFWWPGAELKRGGP